MAHIVIHHLLIPVLLFRSFEAFNFTTGPDCISIIGPQSGPNEGDLSKSTCDGSYTMTSCGFKTSLSTMTTISGSFITQNSTHEICNARNSANSVNGVYSIARCCNLVHFVDCNTYTSTLSTNTEQSMSCSSSNEQLTGCTVHTPGASSLQGSHPGTGMGSNETQNTCTGIRTVLSPSGLYSEATCCEPTYWSMPLECYKFTTSFSSIPDATVRCPNGYFMSGCTGYSDATVNKWGIEVIDGQDTCLARSEPSASGIAAIAICCQINTEVLYFDCRTKQCLYEVMLCENDRDCVVDCAYDNGDTTKGNDEACQNAFVSCGSNAKCEVLCDGNESCDRLRIDGTRATELIVRCNDHIESCGYIFIMCPVDGHCTIIADNVNKNVLYGAEISTVNGLNDVTLNTSTSLASDVDVRCGSQYEYICQVQRSSPHNTCQSGDTECGSVLTSNITLEPVNSVFECRTKPCRYQTLICHDNVPCTVDCAFDNGDAIQWDDQACKHSTVICPDSAQCNVICDGNEACNYMTIHASGSSELNVTCRDHFESCDEMTIICPHTSEPRKCRITAYNDQFHVFRWMIVLAMRGMKDIIFTNSSSLQSPLEVLGGNDYEDVWDVYNIFNCSSWDSAWCKWNNLMCHNEMDCIIHCGVHHKSCYDAAIHCPENQKCEVRCTSSQACDDIKVWGNNATELVIVCDDYDKSCANADIYCPVAAEPGKCQLSLSNGTYDSMVIYAVNGSNDVVLTGTQSNVSLNMRCGMQYEKSCALDNTFDCSSAGCRGLNISCNDDVDCAIECGSWESCKYATIMCPSNHGCLVHCNEYEACEYTEIHALDSTDLRLVCGNYNQSCKGIDVYCPGALRYGMCAISGDRDDTRKQFLDMEIFAVNGLNDVAFTLQQSPLQHDIVVHCGSLYDNSCVLEQSDPFKYCVASGHVCDYKPTSAPSNNPTSLAPTNPPYPLSTLYPSSIPSYNPSISPFDSPTAHPSPLIPTKKPSPIPTTTANPSTRIPTANPTNTPIQPSMIPTSPSIPTQLPFTATQPTYRPLDEGEVHEVTYSSTQNMDHSQEPDVDQGLNVIQVLEKYWILLLIGVIACAIFCGVCVLYRRLKRRKTTMQQTTNEMEKHEDVLTQHTSQRIQTVPFEIASEGTDITGMLMDALDAKVERVGSDGEGESVLQSDHVTAGEFDDMDAGEDGNASHVIQTVGSASIDHDFVNAAEMDEVVLGDDETDIGSNTPHI
eukprot:513240_1